MTRQVCEEVHYMVEFKEMAGQECNHVPMEHWLDHSNQEYIVIGHKVELINKD